VKSHTSIPVPKVLAWSSDASNSVGAEYIFLEKIPGIELFSKWKTMNLREKAKLIGRIVDAEAELAKIPFPAYGSLYLQESLPENLREPLSSTVDGSGLYCVGPPSHKAYSDVMSKPTGEDKGPCQMNLSILYIILADRSHRGFSGRVCTRSSTPSTSSSRDSWANQGVSRSPRKPRQVNTVFGASPQSDRVIETRSVAPRLEPWKHSCLR
jgi:hypothetical protein